MEKPFNLKDYLDIIDTIEVRLESLKKEIHTELIAQGECPHIAVKNITSFKDTKRKFFCPDCRQIFYKE